MIAHCVLMSGSALVVLDCLNVSLQSSPLQSPSPLQCSTVPLACATVVLLLR
jgi:hypothetical protein